MKAKIVILNINENVDYEITSDNGLISFTRGIQSTTDNTKLYYGTVAGYGNIKFYDNNNDIERYANLGYLKDRKKVQLYLGNEIVGTYETSKFSKEGQIVTLELQDVLLRSKNIQIPFILKENYKNQGFSNIGYLIENLLISNGYEVSSNFTTIITSKLKNLEESDFILESSLWDLLDKLCKAFQICVFTNEKGEIDTNVNPNIKTLKIANKDYYTTPKLNPFNNNSVDNVSISRYWKVDNEDLFNSESVWNGINVEKGIKFDLFYRNSQSYYRQDFLYADKTENEDYVKANEVAYKTREYNGTIGGYLTTTKSNLMYLSFRIPVNRDYEQGNFTDNNGFLNSKLSLSCKARTFMNIAGSSSDGVIGKYTIDLEESSVGVGVLEDAKMFETLFDELIGLDYYNQNENPISFTSYWYIQSGEYIELYLLVPINFYTEGNYNYAYTKEFIYEEFTLAINGVKTYKIETSTTKLFTDKDVNLELYGNELVTINNAEKIISNVYANWKDGKKTLNFTCYKGNYYDTNGNLVYNSSSGDTIKVGDTILPYKNVGGIEKPIGNVDDDIPVEYVVTTSEISYNGNIKVNISAQEK